VDTDFGSDNMMAERPDPKDKKGASSSKSTASPH
jgi:beta-lactamase class C